MPHLVDVIVEYIRGVFALYLNYPSPARNVWVVVERHLICLFHGVTDPPPVHAGFKSAVSKLFALPNDDAEGGVVNQLLVQPSEEQVESSEPFLEAWGSQCLDSSQLLPDFDEYDTQQEYSLEVTYVPQPSVTDPDDNDHSRSKSVSPSPQYSPHEPFSSRVGTGGSVTSIPVETVRRGGKGAKLPREDSTICKRKRVDRKL